MRKSLTSYEMPPMNVDGGGAITLPTPKTMPHVSLKPDRQSRFMLDQAALIFPSTLGRVQHHIFNFSVALRDQVDIACLEQALEKLRLRFPTIFVRLKTNAFQYYLETLEQAPAVTGVIGDRLKPMPRKALAESCIRVQAEGHEISLDFFHAVTDGYGALVFVKTLLAAYLSLKYGVHAAPQADVLPLDEEPRAGEMEDSFLSSSFRGWNAAGLMSRAFKHHGTPSNGQYETSITLQMEQLQQKARAFDATVTELLSSMLLIAGNSLRTKHSSPTRIAVPINLRRRFSSKTLRNFSLGCTVGTNGETELCRIIGEVQEQLHAQCQQDALQGAIAAVQRLGGVLRGCAPLLPMKNAVLKLGYALFGSQSATMALSNLGRCDLPSVMLPYVQEIACRSDTNAADTHSCTVMTFCNQTVIRMGRSICEDDLESAFCEQLGREQLSFSRAEAMFAF